MTLRQPDKRTAKEYLRKNEESINELNYENENENSYMNIVPATQW